MTSIISLKKSNKIKPWAVIFWILVWQGLSMYIDREILLASPLSVLNRLTYLIGQSRFWLSILSSAGRIMTGFALATSIAIAMAIFAAKSSIIEQLLEPLMLFIKATPIVSIIILLLIWFSSRQLAIIVSFLMVMPIVYTNVLSGIKNTDVKLLEMAKVFRMPTRKKILYIYVSQVLPFFKAACLIALGLSWKSGIAAEVIGIPTGSIGANLHQARIFLATADVLAWTVTIIVISTLFEHVFMFLLDQVIHRLERL